MDWVTAILDACRSSAAYNYTAGHPEAVLPAGAMLYILLRRNLKAALILAFGAALCSANYYMFAQQLYSAVPIIYVAGFMAVSAMVLVLLVYQLIHAE